MNISSIRISNKVKSDESLCRPEKYKEAMDVVDSIDWRRVKNVHTLCVVGEIYAANRRYQESREIFLLAYNGLRLEKIFCTG